VADDVAQRYDVQGEKLLCDGCLREKEKESIIIVVLERLFIPPLSPPSKTGASISVTKRKEVFDEFLLPGRRKSEQPGIRSRMIINPPHNIFMLCVSMFGI
jgi:hypothetical protein